jgi:hypothetical protein
VASRLDSLDKRGKKGYLFLTGDEIALSPITKEEVKNYLDRDIEDNLTIEQVVEMVRQKYEVYFLLVNNEWAHMQKSEQFWTKLLGKQHVIVVEDLDHISELISMILARGEDVVDTISDAIALVAAEGGDVDLAKRAGKELALFDSYRQSVAKVADSTGVIPTPADSDAVVTRL